MPSRELDFTEMQLRLQTLPQVMNTAIRELTIDVRIRYGYVRAPAVPQVYGLGAPEGGALSVVFRRRGVVHETNALWQLYRSGESPGEPFAFGRSLGRWRGRRVCLAVPSPAC